MAAAMSGVMRSMLVSCVGGGVVHIQAAFLIADAVNNSAALILAAATEHAEFSAPERDVAKLVRRIVKFAAVIFRRAAAVVGVLIKQRLRFFDAREREIMSLDAIAIIFHRHQINARGMQHAHDHQ